MLLNSKKSLKYKMLCLTNQIYSVLCNAFEFKEITEVQNAHLKMLLEAPRGCKYPTPQCELAKILPETTVRAQFRQIEDASPTTHTFLKVPQKRNFCILFYSPNL